MKKDQIQKIVKAVKSLKLEKKFPQAKYDGLRLDINYRERDMRKEAIDMGSHGAKEMWGDSNG